MSELKNDTTAEPKKATEFDNKIDELMLRKRRILFSNQVDDKSAAEVIRKLWYLDDLDSTKPILLVINSPGGSVHSGFAIWDQITMINAPVHTLVTGLAASMGSILSLAGVKGKRFATPHSSIMIHQPLIAGVIQGQATDLEIQAKEIIKTRELLINIYVEQTGQEPKRIEKALDRDTWLTAKEAKAFGLIDHIVTSYKEIGTD